MPVLLPPVVQTILGWALIGYAIYSWLNRPEFGEQGKPRNAKFSDPALGAGNWQNPSTSQTPVPITFGTARVNLPMVHYRLEGDDYKDQWLVYAVGENWRDISKNDYGSVKYENMIESYTDAWRQRHIGIWLQDKLFDTRFGFQRHYYDMDDELGSITHQPDRNNDWSWEIPNGRKAWWNWSTGGHHVQSAAMNVGADWTSSEFNVKGGERVNIRTIVAWSGLRIDHNGKGSNPIFDNEGNQIGHVGDQNNTIMEKSGTTASWRVGVQWLAGVPSQSSETRFTWIFGENRWYGDVGSYIGPGTGFSNKTSRYYYSNAGQDEINGGFDVAEEGTFVIVAKLWNLTNDGKFYIDSVTIDAKGIVHYEEVATYGTSLLFMRVHDTDRSLSRPICSVLLTGGPKNPADALYWILTNKELGLGVAKSSIDTLAFTEAASATRYEFNRGYFSDTDIQTVIEEICNCGRLIYSEVAGKHTVYYDTEIPANKALQVDLDYCAANIKYGEASIYATPNRFEIKYVDSEKEEYVLSSLIYDDVEMQAQAGCVNEYMIDLSGCTDVDDAWELGWYYAHYAMKTKSLEFTVLPSVWDLVPGAVIVTSSENDKYLHGREWVVIAVEEGEPYQYTVKCKEYARMAYHPDTRIVIPPYIPIDRPPALDWSKLSLTTLVRVEINKTSVDTTGAKLKLTLRGIDTIHGTYARLCLYVKYPDSGAPNAVIALTEFAYSATGEYVYSYTESHVWESVIYMVTAKVYDESHMLVETDRDKAGITEYYVMGDLLGSLGYGVGPFGSSPYGE